jgi:hypothetical protein
VISPEIYAAEVVLRGVAGQTVLSILKLCEGSAKFVVWFLFRPEDARICDSPERPNSTYD